MPKNTFDVISYRAPYKGEMEPDSRLFSDKSFSVTNNYDDLSQALIAFNQASDSGNKELWVIRRDDNKNLIGAVELMQEQRDGYSQVLEPWMNEEDISKFSDEMVEFINSDEFSSIRQKAEHFVDYDEMFTEKTFFIEETETPNGETYLSAQVDGPGQNIDCSFYDKDMLLLYKEQMPFDGENLDSLMFQDVLYGTLAREKGIPVQSLLAVDNVKFRECTKEAYQKDVIKKLGIGDDFMSGLNELGWTITFSDSARPHEYAVELKMIDSKFDLMCFAKSYEGLLDDIQSKTQSICKGKLLTSVNPEATRKDYADLGEMAGQCLKADKSLKSHMAKLMKDSQPPKISRNVQVQKQDIHNKDYLG